MNDRVIRAVNHTTLGAGAEFDAVRGLVQQLGAAARGIGDDAGGVRVPDGEEVLVSTDVAVENVHFRRAWFTPEEIGFRSTVAALSDLAAMAATPRALVVALIVPAAWRAEVNSLAAGVAAAASDADVPVIGGDLSDGTALALAITVVGSAASPLRRSGAAPGQGVWVTGCFGGPTLALRALVSGSEPPPAARARFAHPSPRIREALWLAAQGATACIDISDGLGSDLAHVAAASGVRIAVDGDAVPLHPGASAANAAAGGEEYELAVTAHGSFDATAFAREFGIPLTRIGAVQAGPPGIEWRSHGEVMELPRGYDHFGP